MQVVLRQCAALAHLFKSAGLYKRWRGLAKLHFSLQPTLVLGRHVGDFYRGVERHPGFIDHFENVRNKVRETNITLYRLIAFTSGVSNQFCGARS